MKRRNPNKFPVKRYFNAVRDDPDLLEEAFQYYHDAAEDGMKHAPVIGRLEDLLAEQPGLLGFYQPIRTDVQQLRRWVENNLISTEAERYKWFHSDDGIREYGQLNHTSILKYISAEDEVVILKETIRGLAECEHALEDLITTLDKRGMILSKIVDARIAGVQEVWVNPYKETKNE